MIINKEHINKLQKYWKERKIKGFDLNYLYIKNYKTLADIMGISYQGGNKKITILKDLMKWTDYEKKKEHGFRIYNIYSDIRINNCLELNRIQEDLNNKELKFFTYFDFCKYLKIICNKKEKTKQLKAISYFIDYEKKDNERFKIIGIKHPFIEKRNEIFQYIPQPEYYNKAGIYKIETKDKIFIGRSTNFYKTYYLHISTTINTETNKMLNEENGQFIILTEWDNIDEKELKEYEIKTLKTYQDKIKNNIINKKLINILLINDEGYIYNKNFNQDNKKKYHKIRFYIKNEDRIKVEELLKNNNIDYEIIKTKNK